MTRAKVLQIGLLVLLLGGTAYGAFQLLGLESASAGIASEAVLVALVFVWIGSYLFRVVTGKMTFMEQRKRYRQTYEELTNKELLKTLDAMPEEERNLLLKELEVEKNGLDYSED